jgi:hypothetical protein
MIRILTLVSGEVVITKIKEAVEEGNSLHVDYPAVLMPVQENRLGFMKYLPFSDNDETIAIMADKVVSESTPIKGLSDAYENWVTQTKAGEAGIITPNPIVSPV